MLLVLTLICIFFVILYSSLILVRRFQSRFKHYQLWLWSASIVWILYYLFLGGK